MKATQLIALVVLCAIGGCGLDFDTFEVDGKGAKIGAGKGGPDDGSSGSGSGNGGDGSGGDDGNGGDGSGGDGGGVVGASGTGGDGAGGDGGAIDSGDDGTTVAAATCKEAKCDPAAECNDDTGEALCACPAGYDDPKGDGKRCIDRDECDLEKDNCHANADCVNAAPGFMCRCKSGFNGDGVENCERNALCNADGSNCAADVASCKTLDSVKYCVCNPGYLGDGETCTNIDECTEGTDDCDPSKICMDSEGAFSCLDCLAPTDCTASTNPCQVASCSATNVCGFDNLSNTMACPIGHCDGSGTCKCSQKSDCPNAADACITGQCVPTTCGDGMTAGTEECDDDNNSNTDACTNACQDAECGDGYTQAGVEACDDDNNSNTDDCTNSCQSARCGDGFTHAGVEACDDGNGSNTDGCTNACVIAKCRDGYTRAGVEECDDNNASNNDACTNTCENAECGDGYIRTGVDECEVGVSGWTSSTCRSDCGRNYYRKCTNVSTCDGAEMCSGDFAMCTKYVQFLSDCLVIPGYTRGWYFNICALQCVGAAKTCPPGLICYTDNTLEYPNLCLGKAPPPV